MSNWKNNEGNSICSSRSNYNSSSKNNSSSSTGTGTGSTGSTSQPWFLSRRSVLWCSLWNSCLMINGGQSRRTICIKAYVWYRYSYPVWPLSRSIMFVWESYLSELPCINNGTILSSILLFYSNGWVDAMYFCTVSSLSITSVTGHTKADSGKPTGQLDDSLHVNPLNGLLEGNMTLGEAVLFTEENHWRQSLKGETQLQSDYTI